MTKYRRDLVTAHANDVQWQSQLARILSAPAYLRDRLHDSLTDRDLPVEILFMHCRWRPQVIRRRRVWHDLRQRGLSFPEIARACGMRSHSTIVTAINKHPIVKVHLQPRGIPMTGIAVGDEGQRFEVSFQHDGESERQVMGWCEDDGIAGMFDAIDHHPAWHSPRVLDRRTGEERTSVHLVWVVSGFRGHYPVGTSAVAVAVSEEQARERINIDLRARGLPDLEQDDSLSLLRLDEPNAFILNDGNY